MCEARLGFSAHEIGVMPTNSSSVWMRSIWRAKHFSSKELIIYSDLDPWNWSTICRYSPVVL